MRNRGPVKKLTKKRADEMARDIAFIAAHLSDNGLIEDGRVDDFMMGASTAVGYMHDGISGEGKAHEVMRFALLRHWAYICSGVLKSEHAIKKEVDDWNKKAAALREASEGE